jgi:hypothetical protein
MIVGHSACSQFRFNHVKEHPDAAGTVWCFVFEKTFEFD